MQRRKLLMCQSRRFYHGAVELERSLFFHPFILPRFWLQYGIPAETSLVFRRNLTRFILKTHIPLLRRRGNWWGLHLRVDKIQADPSPAWPVGLAAIHTVRYAFVTFQMSFSAGETASPHSFGSSGNDVAVTCFWFGGALHGRHLCFPPRVDLHLPRATFPGISALTRSVALPPRLRSGSIRSTRADFFFSL